MGRGGGGFAREGLGERRKTGRLRSRIVACAALVVGLTSACEEGDGEEAGQATTTSSAPAAEAFCTAYEDMVEAQQGWTTEFLSGLTAAEAAANEAEQAAAAERVRELMPPQFAEDWDSTAAVGERVQDLIDELRPPGGTLEPVLADVRAQGFGSITEFVFRDGLEVDGRSWTFEEYIEAGASTDAAIGEFCSSPP
jgi:hypothetical protein